MLDCYTLNMPAANEPARYTDILRRHIYSESEAIRPTNQLPANRL